MVPASPRRGFLRRAAALSVGLAGCATPAPDRPADSPTPTETGEATDRPAQTTAVDATPSAIPTPSIGDSPVRRVAFGTTRFALDLFARLAERSPDANLLASPYSAAVALAMTYAGARGETRREMRETLRFPFEGERLHGAFEAFRERRLPAPETPTTATPTETPVGYHDPAVIGANRIWGQEGLPYRGAYLSMLRKFYGAGLRELDFAGDPAGAVEAINGWVAEKTRGEIRRLVTERNVNGNTRIVLTNALYFNALWDHPFTDETNPGTFTALDGSTSRVPMMVNEETYPYASVNGHQVVELPYRNLDYAMTIVLPKEGEFERFQRTLTAETLWGLIEATETRVGTVWMPKFDYHRRMPLREHLSAMGMPSAFGPGANLDGMLEGDADAAFSISDVVQEATITVNETGTEAAASTAVVIQVSAVHSDQPFEITLDRPFLYLIRDRETGMPLFLGRVADP